MCGVELFSRGSLSCPCLNLLVLDVCRVCLVSRFCTTTTKKMFVTGLVAVLEDLTLLILREDERVVSCWKVGEQVRMMPVGLCCCT